VGIKLRFSDFQTITRDRTVDTPLDDGTSIRRLAFECLGRIALERPVRLVGVRVGELSPADDTADRLPGANAKAPPRSDEGTLPLFDDE
jgi:DNA polymerase-4